MGGNQQQLDGAVNYRIAVAADMPAIRHVRTSATENHLSREQLDARGITNEAVAASFVNTSKGWVAIVDDGLIGFSIANRETRSIFALFMLPGFESKGHGTALLSRATEWLWANGDNPIWLTTGAQTRAASFYRRRGWTETGREPDGQIRFELRNPK